MNKTFTLDVSGSPDDVGGGKPCSKRTQAETETVGSGCGG